MTKVILIAATSLNRVIGNKGQIPWHIKEEFQHFKETTMGGILIMGRKTFDSIGKPLPGRTTFVVSSNTELKIDGVVVFSSFGEALHQAIKVGYGIHQNVYICGGGQVYKEALTYYTHYIDEILLSVIQQEYEGDAFFPEVNKKFFKKESTKSVPYGLTGVYEFKVEKYKYKTKYASKTYEGIKNGSILKIAKILKLPIKSAFKLEPNWNCFTKIKAGEIGYTEIGSPRSFEPLRSLAFQDIILK